jgi:hypothetical protein
MSGHLNSQICWHNGKRTIPRIRAVTHASRLRDKERLLLQTKNPAETRLHPHRELTRNVFMTKNNLYFDAL